MNKLTYHFVHIPDRLPEIWNSQYGWENVTRGDFRSTIVMAGNPSLPQLFIDVKNDIRTGMRTDALPEV